MTIRLALVFFITVLMQVSLVHAQEAERSTADFIQDGNLNLSRGDCSFAQYFFQEALKKEANNLDASLGKGKALVCQGAYALGIEEFQRIISADSNHIDAHIQLARAYQEQFASDPERFSNRLTDALGIIDNAERLDAENSQVLNTKGVILFLLGNVAEARTALEKAVTLASGNEEDFDKQDLSLMNVNLGKAYRDLDELELALQAFRRATTLNPASSSAHNNVGEIHYRLGNCEEAIYELTQAANLNPGSLDGVSNLAIALFECGNLNASIPRLEQALDIPGSLNIPPLYTYLSRAYVNQGRFDEAVKRAQQGALLPPSSAEAFYFLGQAYEARKLSDDVDRAKEAYQSALDISPNYKSAQDALNQLP